MEGVTTDRMAAARLQKVDAVCTGVGDEGRQRERLARWQKVGVCLQAPSTKVQLAVVRSAMQNFDSITYFLTGGEREGVGVAKLPRRLALLLKPGMSLGKKRAVATEFFSLRPGCVGPFGARLQSLFPSADDGLSPLAEATPTVWLRSMLWTT